MTAARVILGIAAGALSAGAVFACEPPLVKREKPVKQGASCSFTQAGPYNVGRGTVAQDLGDGRVVQDVTGYFWAARVLTDCQTGERLVIRERPLPADQQTSCGEHFPIADGFAPKGPLDPRAAFAVLAEQAQSAGHRLEPNGRLPFDHKRRRHRVDHTCGCALFYPGSAGAEK